jgi:hypothetical protein
MFPEVMGIFSHAVGYLSRNIANRKCQKYPHSSCNKRLKDREAYLLRAPGFSTYPFKHNTGDYLDGITNHPRWDQIGSMAQSHCCCWQQQSYNSPFSLPDLSTSKR